jgi:chaperonin GroEL
MIKDESGKEDIVEIPIGVLIAEAMEKVGRKALLPLKKPKVL